VRAGTDRLQARDLATHRQHIASTSDVATLTFAGPKAAWRKEPVARAARAGEVST